jgi:hypothetical protein
MVELNQCRIIVSVIDIKFEGGILQQKPPYALVVELPVLNERESFCLWCWFTC